METKIYRGRLLYGSNGEEDEILYIDDGDTDWSPPFLSEQILEDLTTYGSYVTVRYYISNMELPEDEMRKEYYRTLMGLGDAKYQMVYSDITGYLWTTNELEIGGHDLLEELAQYVGKFIQLEIDYSFKEEE